MNILLKYIYRNILEKKLRTVLVIFSVALSTSLFFATSSVSDSFQAIYESKIREQIGSADVYISGDSASPLIDLSELTMNQDQYKASANIFEFNGAYGDENFRLWATDLSSLNEINPIEFSEKSFEGDLEEFEIVVSSSFAEEYDYYLGDKLDIEISGSPQSFSIVGIALDNNLFSDEVTSRKAISSMDTIETLFSLGDTANIVHIDLNDDTEVRDFMEAIRKNNDGVVVQETISQDELETLRTSIATPFYMILSVILIMSVFIIYSAFKVIVLERMQNIGTFRSVGATRTSTTAILICESLLYGVLGSVLGLGVGIGILELMMRVLGSLVESSGNETTIVFSSIQVILSLSIGIVVSILSSFIPILKVNRYPVKDIVLGFHEDAERDGNGKLYAGLIIISSSLLTQYMVREPDSILLALGSIIAFIVGSILIVPYIIKLFTLVTRGIWTRVLGNESLISLKNINSKVLSNNVTLFVIGISIILTITSVTASVKDFIVGAYDSMDYDIKVENLEDYDLLREQLESVEGLDDIYTLLEAWNVPVSNSNERIISFHGIDPDLHLDFFGDIELLQNSDLSLDELEREDTVILHKTLAKRLDLGVGDMIDIEIDGRVASLEVVGTLDSMLGQSGRYAISSRSTMEELFSDYNETALLRGLDIQDDVRSALGGQAYLITSIEDEREAVIDDNMSLMMLLQGFIYMATVVGIFGIINNLVVSFLQRKRDIAVFRSIGMSKGQVSKMFVMEGIFSGLLGAGLGSLLGIILISMVPYIVSAMDMPMKVVLSPGLIAIHFIVGGLIILISSSSLMLKSSKVSIIQEIRYE